MTHPKDIINKKIREFNSKNKSKGKNKIGLNKILKDNHIEVGKHKDVLKVK